MLQYKLKMAYLVTVPPEAFDPAPKVESAFVRCTPYQTLPYHANDEALFAQVVQAAFSQRRKTIRNTLKPFMSDEDFSQIKIGSQLRAENLSVEDYVTITNYLARRQST
jgi:16S rRNA (adenine1518-N6/adenine1519-N6)-dimethyltransferase